MSKSTSTTLKDPAGYQPMLAGSQTESPIWKRAECILPILFVFLHGAYYNPLGELAAHRGVDFGPILETPLDQMIPFSSLYIIPYTALWLLPVFMIVQLTRRPESSMATLRRITIGFIALILMCYVFWLAFPSSFTARMDIEVLTQHGWLGKLIVFNYDNISPWNSFPSFHVAAPWFICRIYKLYTDKVPWYVWTLTIAICMSTLGIRIHYFLDIPAGIIVAEAVYRLVLVRMEKRKLFEQYPSRKMVSIYAYSIVGAIGALFAMLAIVR